MTREEAERAAATFEFPPFRASKPYLRHVEADGTEAWSVDIFGGPPDQWRTFTPATWLDSMPSGAANKRLMGYNPQQARAAVPRPIFVSALGSTRYDYGKTRGLRKWTFAGN